MKSSGLLKWLTLPAVLLAVLIAVNLFSTPQDDTTGPSTADWADESLTPAESKALGVDADSPHDTVATLVGQVKQFRRELKSAVEDNAKQKATNDRLRQRDSAIDQRIQNAIRAERERRARDEEKSQADARATQGVIDDLQRRFDTLNKRAGHAELPVGLGLDDGETTHTGAEQTHWVEPQDAAGSQRTPDSSTRASRASDGQFGLRFEETAHQIEDTVDAAANTLPSRERLLPTASVTPVYTVTSDATLVGSVAMTALVGRIPIDGTVNDPYPFKIVIGADNLTANGVELPDLAGAVASGTATGDWTLSCVRGRIRSLTYVFNDGTVRTVPSSTGSLSTRASSAEGGLGWISDPYGIPCVSGRRISNARQYLTTQTLVTAAGAAAASLIDSDTGNLSFVRGSDGSSLGTVGITGDEAMGRVLAGGVHDVSQWVEKLYGQATAAIYVPPSAQVAVHIEVPLEIDFDARGRKVKHHFGGPHASDLD